MVQWLIPTKVILGNKTNTINRNSNDKRIKNDSGFDQWLGISAQSAHTLFRALFGIIYAFGSNSYDQFGDRKSRFQTSVVKGLDYETTTQLACAKDSGIAHVCGSIDDGRIVIDPAIANVLYERMIFERNLNERRRNENPYLKAGNNNNNNTDNNSGAPNRLSPDLREHIESTSICSYVAQEEEKMKENDDSVTATTAANEGGGGLDDDDNDNNQNGNEHKINEENELIRDVLLQDILSKFSFDEGAICVWNVGWACF